MSAASVTSGDVYGMWGQSQRLRVGVMPAEVSPRLLRFGALLGLPCVLMELSAEPPDFGDQPGDVLPGVGDEVGSRL